MNEFYHKYNTDNIVHKTVREMWETELNTLR